MADITPIYWNSTFIIMAYILIAIAALYIITIIYYKTKELRIVLGYDCREVELLPESQEKKMFGRVKSWNRMANNRYSVRIGNEIAICNYSRKDMFDDALRDKKFGWWWFMEWRIEKVPVTYDFRDIFNELLNVIKNRSMKIKFKDYWKKRHPDEGPDFVQVALVDNNTSQVVKQCSRSTCGMYYPDSVTNGLMWDHFQWIDNTQDIGENDVCPHCEGYMTLNKPETKHFLNFLKPAYPMSRDAPIFSIVGHRIHFNGQTHEVEPFARNIVGWEVINELFEELIDQREKFAKKLPEKKIQMVGLQEIQIKTMDGRVMTETINYKSPAEAKSAFMRLGELTSNLENQVWGIKNERDGAVHKYMDLDAQYKILDSSIIQKQREKCRQCSVMNDVFEKEISHLIPKIRKAELLGQDLKSVLTQALDSQNKEDQMKNKIIEKLISFIDKKGNTESDDEELENFLKQKKGDFE